MTMYGALYEAEDIRGILNKKLSKNTNGSGTAKEFTLFIAGIDNFSEMTENILFYISRSIHRKIF